MRITEITVSAGRVIPHPRESYANLRPMLSLRASIGEEEDVAVAVIELQCRAEDLLSVHVNALVSLCEKEYQARRKREDEAYKQRQHDRLLAAGMSVDDLDDDEIEDEEGLEEIQIGDIEEDEEE